MIEVVQAVVVMAIVAIFASAPTALVFATARRLVRPRNFLPTVKLSVLAILLTLFLGIAFDVVGSGSFMVHAIYVAVASPMVALFIVGLWVILVKRLARKAKDHGEATSAE